MCLSVVQIVQAWTEVHPNTCFDGYADSKHIIIEKVSFQITKLHLDWKLANYVCIGPVNEKLNVMPQIEEKHEECVWLFLGVLWNTDFWISVSFQGLVTNAGFDYYYHMHITNSDLTA